MTTFEPEQTPELTLSTKGKALLHFTRLRSKTNRNRCRQGQDPYCSPRHQGGQLRRLDPDRPVRLRKRDQVGQARAGPRRRQEPHGRAARRRPRPGRGRRHLGRVRLGGGALHGGLRRGGRRPDRRRAGQPDLRPDRRPAGRAWLGPARRDGAAGHRAAPGQGRRPTWTPASAQGATLAVDGRVHPVIGGGARRASGSGPACWTTSPRR